MLPPDETSPSISIEQIAGALTRRAQNLIILPTEKCNFRCTYCYEDFAIGRMSELVQSSIERFMDRRVPELELLTIDWFGGEPLVARNVVLRLSSYGSQICKDHGVSFHGGLTTNAYLLNFDLFEELLSYEQRFFQITLDGWAEGHDAVRKLAGGRGSFERIWQNLTDTRKSSQEFQIQIRVHVRRDNLSSLELLMDNLARTFGNDHRYQLDFQHLRNLGGEGGATVERPLSRRELSEVEAVLRERHNSQVAPRSEPLGAESSRSDECSPISRAASLVSGGTHEICYAAKPNSLMIRADGRIGKCTVALTDDRNTLGRINPDGSLSINNHLLRFWARGLASMDVDTMLCPLVGLPTLNEQELATQ